MNRTAFAPGQMASKNGFRSTPPPPVMYEVAGQPNVAAAAAATTAAYSQRFVAYTNSAAGVPQNPVQYAGGQIQMIVSKIFFLSKFKFYS